jgi:hypothetical protein
MDEKADGGTRGQNLSSDAWAEDLRKFCEFASVRAPLHSSRPIMSEAKADFAC